MITTYITSTEANTRYPNDSNFTAGQKTDALRDSFDLTNSFIDSQVKTPVMSPWDGESSIIAPMPLKLVQHRFYRYLLESSNVGESDEMQDVLDSIIEFAEKITAAQISITSHVHSIEVGWHIVEITRASDIGGVKIKGGTPDIPYNYTLSVTSASAYVGSGNVQFSVSRSTQSADLSTGNVASYDSWQIVDGKFEVIWDGQWASGDSVQIMGTPQSSVNAPDAPSNVIKQGGVIT